MATLIVVTSPLRTAHGQSRASGSAPLVIGYLAPSGDTSVVRAYHRGVQLGIREAMHAGQLLARGVEYVELRAEQHRNLPHDDLDAHGIRGLIAPGVDSTAIASLGVWASRTGIPVIAIGAVGGARCMPFIFRIASPPSVDVAALLADRAHGPAANVTSDRSGMRMAFWHPSLERFGAAQLSDRFRAQYGDPMTSDAWAGWMAVKILWESSLRADTTAEGLRSAIARSGFDGHKGRALRFWPDNILRQPLMIVKPVAAGGAPDSLVAEVDWPEVHAARDSIAGVTAPSATTHPAPGSAAATCGDAS